MGALAPISSWDPQDDLLLKNAVEAGASLESLAKGAVQFSRRFTVQELQDHWYSLLYDPVVSEEASACMIEFERSASTLPSKSNGFGNLNDNKCFPQKRKVESVRKCYYATRKRICNEPFNSQDLSFLVASSNNNCIGNGDEPPAANFMLGDPISNHFRFQDVNMNMMNRDFPQIVMDSVAAVVNDITSHTFHTGIHEEDFPVEQNNICKEIPHIHGENITPTRNFSGVEEFGQSEELPVHNLFEAKNLEVKVPSTFDHIDEDPGNMCAEFGGSQVFNSAISDCGTSFHNLGYSSPMHGMPIWRTIEGISPPTMPIDVSLKEKDHLTGDTFALPDDDDDVKNTSTSGYDVVHSDSKMKNQMPCDELKSSHASPEGYLVELSDSLLNFTNEEELLYMDDGKDVIDKSYYDGLSSLLLSSPYDVNQDHSPIITEPEASVAPDVYLAITGGTCPGESDDNGGGHTVCNSQVQMPSSVSAVNPQFSELRDGVICCAFNTEDPDIPCNDDVFLPNQMPSSSLSPIMQQSFHEAHNPTSSSLKNRSDIQISSERGPSLMRRDPGQSHVSFQMIGSQLLPEMGLYHPAGDSGVDFGLPKSDSPHVVSRSIACGDPSQIGSANINASALISGKVEGETIEVQSVKHHGYNATDSFLDKPARGSDSFQNCLGTYATGSKLEVDALTTTQNSRASHAELGSIDMVVPQPLGNPSTSDQEEFPSESDDDVPCFSDVEAVILDMDLDPDDRDLYSMREASRYQREETKRAIIRLEQGAHSHMQRAIASHGAFAVVYGRHSKHYIKKTEVLVGRTTEDVDVDIDLGREGHANKISRRQAIIKMDKTGSFHLTNLGKCSILVNSKELVPGQSLSLNSSCLIEIRGMPFIFETNQTCVKQYLDNITMGNETQEHSD